MKLMIEKDRNEIISEVKKFGGLGLYRQSLRLHKNGAKFPISKTYIDDGLLDPEITYTLILIPEIKIATKTTVALSYFTRKQGPKLFYSYPESTIDEELSNQIANIMDRAYQVGFLVHQSSIISSSLNYYFEIPSEWARGNKEMLMITVMLDFQTNELLEETVHQICADFASQIESTEDIFKALYVKLIDNFPDKDRMDIKTINRSLKVKIKEFYDEISIIT